MGRCSEPEPLEKEEEVALVEVAPVFLALRGEGKHIVRNSLADGTEAGGAARLVTSSHRGHSERSLWCWFAASYQHRQQRRRRRQQQQQQQQHPGWQ